MFIPKQSRVVKAFGNEIHWCVPTSTQWIIVENGVVYATDELVSNDVCLSVGRYRGTSEYIPAFVGEGECPKFCIIATVEGGVTLIWETSDKRFLGIKKCQPSIELPDDFVECYKHISKVQTDVHLTMLPVEEAKVVYEELVATGNVFAMFHDEPDELESDSTSGSSL